MADARPRRSVFDLDTPLGRDYAAVEWSSTSLGEPATWPDSLRHTVALMLSSRFAMWMAWGPDLTFFCNDAYRRDTLGTKYPWALGRPTREVWAEIWADVLPLIERVVHNGESTWDEALQLFLERNGYVEETYHTFSYSPLRDGNDRIAGLFCVVSEDTGRVVSERRITLLRDLSAALADCVTERDVFAAAGTCLASDDSDLPFVACYLYGSDPELAGLPELAFTAGIEPGHPIIPPVLDLSRTDLPWTLHWPSDGVSRVIDDLGRYSTELPTGAWSTPPVQAMTVPLIRSGGEGIAGCLTIGMNPHRPIDDDCRGFVILVAGQIAAGRTRARSYEADRSRAEQMAELDRAKTAFFTNVSHELRTPLTLLLGPAEDALVDPAEPLGSTQRSRLEVIHRNGERLLTLVNTLLDFSRLESDRVQARFEPVDLAALTTELASMFESAFDRSGLTFAIDCAPLDQAIYVDREMWAKIVLNLLSNALKATFTGSVTVRLQPGPTAASLSITDTGVGIAQAEQARLFERFHRVVGAALRSHEGSGIGLALVAELAALHGGAVAVLSTPGVGSTFTVSIPYGTTHLPADLIAVDGPAEAVGVSSFGTGFLAEARRWADTDTDLGRDTENDAENVDAEALAVKAGRRRVLVVDDNVDMRRYIADLLSPDYHVESAQDGAQALRLARTEPPDLVLTDVMMPVLDGFGLLAELRADPSTMHVPVIMLSARSGGDAATEGLEAGADDYLIKPFSQRELLARVRSNLELDRVRRVVAELERNRAMLAHAEEIAHLGSFEFDAVVDSIDGTPQFFALLRANHEQLREDGLASASRLIDPADAERVTSAIRVSLSDGTPLDVEFRLAGLGQIMWLRGSVELDAEGNALSIRGSMQDVTARLATERAEREASAALIVAAREQAIAHELQTTLLPARSFDADHLDIAGYYAAGVEGTEVGGDWYDVIELDAGRTALVLGDVMGRGIRAAAIMGQLKATVRAYARIELAPDTLLHLLDDAVRDISDDMIVTCVYAVYEPSDQTLTYANAGHLPPLLTIPGQPTRRLVSGGPPLGAGRGWGKPETVSLPTGATFTLYTDGLVEQRGENIDDGITRVQALLEESRWPLEEIPGQLTRALLASGQDDDVAVLVARVSDRSTADRVVTRHIDSDITMVGGAREFAASTLVDWGVGESMIDDVRLIVSELVTNAIVHGRPPVELRLRMAGSRLLLEILDSAVTTPQLRNAKATDDHGRGLLIVSMLAERWGTRPTTGGKSVWCQLRLR